MIDTGSLRQLPFNCALSKKLRRCGYERGFLTAELGSLKSVHAVRFKKTKPLIILIQMGRIVLALFLVSVMSPLSLAQTFSIATAPRLYSSNFVQPQPHMIQTEFRANYMQHKYDVNVNNIVSGFVYFSPTLQKIRADGAFDTILETSIFDFTNTTVNGTVSNPIQSFQGGVTVPTCTFGFVEPFLQLFPADTLTQQNAVYTGIRKDEIHGLVSTWTFLTLNLSVTFFLDANNTLVRFDFAASDDLRTFATTRFFNIIEGPSNATVFQTRCLME